LSDAVKLSSFLQHPLRFVSTAIEIAAVTECGFQVAHGVAEPVGATVDLVFATSAVYAAAIECPVQVSFKIFRQAIQSVN
jgi:hypothetical protein